MAGGECYGVVSEGGRGAPQVPALEPVTPTVRGTARTGVANTSRTAREEASAAHGTSRASNGSGLASARPLSARMKFHFFSFQVPTPPTLPYLTLPQVSTPLRPTPRHATPQGSKPLRPPHLPIAPFPPSPTPVVAFSDSSHRFTPLHFTPLRFRHFISLYSSLRFT